MTDYSGFKSGGTTYPITASTTNTLLRDADPALYYATNFIAGVLAIHIGPRLVAEAARTTIAAPIAAAVQYTVSVDPGPNLTDTRFRWPLLAVYRIGGVRNSRTVVWRHLIAQWGITYVLPPMTMHQAEAIYPIMKSVGDVIDNRITLGFDPAYNNGQKVWSLAGIEAIEFNREEYGTFAIPNGMQFFLAWRGFLTVTERVSQVAGQFGTFAGADVAEDIKAGDGTTVADVVDFKSNVTPPGPG